MQSNKPGPIADAPYRKDWHVQLFKRSLRDAVDRGMSWVGWTSGQTQVERWNRTGDEATKMARFYDQVIPQDVQKYVKQWGGQVERIEIPAGENTEIRDAQGKRYATLRNQQPSTVDLAAYPEGFSAVPEDSTAIWRVNITPAMREGIQTKGQALFSQAPGRNYESMDFEPPFKSPRGDILSYSWMNDGQRSDWNQAKTNPDTGREIVHHFKIRSPRGDVSTVSLETAMGALSPDRRKQLGNIIDSERQRRQDVAGGQGMLFSQQSDQSFKSDMQGQADFFTKKMHDAGYETLENVPDDIRNNWSNEWRKNHVRWDEVGRQLFSQLPSSADDSKLKEDGIPGTIPQHPGAGMAQAGNGQKAESPWRPAPDKSSQTLGGPYGIPAERYFEGIPYEPARAWGVARLADHFHTSVHDRNGIISSGEGHLPIYRSDFKENAKAYADASWMADKLFQSRLSQIDAHYADHPGKAYRMLPRTPQARALFTDAAGTVHLLDHPNGEIKLAQNGPLFSQKAQDERAHAAGQMMMEFAPVAKAAEPKSDPLTPEQSKLMTDNMGLAHMLENKMVNARGWDRDEARQESALALAKAAKAYDPERGFKFSTFAVKVMNNHMKDIGLKSNKDKARMFTTLDITGSEDQDSTTLKDQIEGGISDSQPDSDGLATFRRLVTENIPDKIRSMMEEYGNGSNYDEIGKRRGISRQAAQQAIDKGTRKLVARLQQNGITSSRDIFPDTSPDEPAISRSPRTEATGTEDEANTEILDARESETLNSQKVKDDYHAFIKAHEDVADIEDAALFIGTQNEESAALAAFSRGAFAEINSDPESPVTKTLLEALEGFPNVKDVPAIHRVLGFDTAEKADDYVKGLGGFNEQKQRNPVTSWTRDDPRSDKAGPMTNIGLDVASQFGDHNVILTIEKPKTAKDVSFLYGKKSDGSGLEYLMTEGTTTRMTNAKKTDKGWQITLRETRSNPEEITNLFSQQPFNTVTDDQTRAELGRAQPLTAKVKTRMGWAEIGDLAPGDEIADPEGGWQFVNAIYRQGDLPVQRITTETHRATEASEDHLWRYQDQESSSDNMVTTTSNLVEGFRIPVMD